MSTNGPYPLHRSELSTVSDSSIHSPIVRGRSNSSSGSSKDSITREFNASSPLTFRIQKVFGDQFYVSNACLQTLPCKRPGITSSFIRNFSPSSERNSENFSPFIEIDKDSFTQSKLKENTPSPNQENPPEKLNSGEKIFSHISDVQNSTSSVQPKAPCTTYILWRNPYNVPIKIFFDDTEPVTHTYETPILGIQGLPSQTISFTRRDTSCPIPPSTIKLEKCNGKTIRIKVVAGSQPDINLIPRSSSPPPWLKV